MNIDRPIEQKSSLERIASLCRLEIHEVNNEELKYIYGLLDYLHNAGVSEDDRKAYFESELLKNPEIIFKYLQKPLIDASEREVIEYKQELCQLIESELDVPANTISFGTHFPSHLPIINEFIKLNNPFNTLLIGSLTPSSQIEYEGLRHVSNLISPYTIDLETAFTGKVSEGGFVIADGRSLPFKNNSLEIIFTSCLFRDLHLNTSQHYNEIYKILFEAYRCLTSKGKISIVEIPIGDKNEFMDIIYIILKIIGFNSIKISNAKGYNSRTQNDYNNVTVDTDIVNIVASK